VNQLCSALGLASLLGLASPQSQAASLPPVEAEHGMVVSAQRLASGVGLDILRQGGNAIDAAVAVGYALAVVYPCCGNLGGGGFMLVHLASGRDTVIDFRETAPLAAKPDMYLDATGQLVPNASTDGYKAVGVPGTVLGLDTALQRYGTLPRAKVMAPAIALAEQGFELSQPDVNVLHAGTDDFAKQPNVAGIFLKPDKSPYGAGDRLSQPQLAASLRRISAQGPDGFYKGPVAQAIVEASKANGGILTLEDFAHYAVIERDPIRCSYRGYQIAAAPPPSSGGITLCEILGILDGYKLGEAGFHSAASVHLMVEAMRHAFLDRNSQLGDPAFVANPVGRLISADYAGKIRAVIDPLKATPSSALTLDTPPHEGSETTHYSVVDGAGNAVAVTYTINNYFGAGVIAGDTGFFLNDEMDDFATKPGSANMFGLVQGKANEVQPGKRPLSSMSPTLVTKDGRLLLILGSPGGPRIITAVAEVICNVVDFGMDIQAAVDAPRFHHQWKPDKIFAEPFALSADTADRLAVMGYQIKVQNPWSAVEAIEVGQPAEASTATGAAPNDSAIATPLRPGYLYGANDSRRPGGAALGY
jgi:gamma-glutamyltranspeptidase/glutathione hydrolase